MNANKRECFVYGIRWNHFSCRHREFAAKAAPTGKAQSVCVLRVTKRNSDHRRFKINQHSRLFAFICGPKDLDTL